MSKPDPGEVLMGSGAENSFELTDQLRRGQAGRTADPGEILLVHKGGMKEVLGDTQPFINFLFGGRFDGAYPTGPLRLLFMRADQMMQQKDQVFIHPVTIISIFIQRSYQAPQSLHQAGIRIIERLEEFKRRTLRLKGIIQQHGLPGQGIAEYGGGKCRLEKNRLDPDFAGCIDLAGIVLVVV